MTQDAITIKIVLTTDDQDNDALLRSELDELLDAWSYRGEVVRVEWKRMRPRFVPNPDKPTDDVYWDAVSS